jgi:acetyl esterase/lipase
MSQSRRFADYESAIPLNDAIISPIDAPSELLAELPPLMLIVGGGETLLGENIAFAQRCHLAGTPAMVQVYTGMWHDFIQESEGCHNTMSTFGHGKPLEEAVTAIQRMGNFFRYNQSCRVVCESDTEFCSGAAPVKVQISQSILALCLLL